MSEVGGYLSYDPVSNGTMFLTWSRTKVEGAIGFGRTSKTVPEHKFKTKCGKNELFRSIQSDKKNWYRAWLEFVKQIHAYDAELFVLNVDNPMPTVIIFHGLEGNVLTKVEAGGSGFQLTGVDAVAAVPRDVTALDVKTMALQMFNQTGNSHGASNQMRV